MPKEKVSISYRFIHFFIYHPWIKFIALLLAIVVWFYVKGEISRFN